MGEVTLVVGRQKETKDYIEAEAEALSAKACEDVMKLGLEEKLGKGMRKWFLFEDGWVNLNHGSFGTYPSAVRTALLTFQEASEKRPDFFIRYLYPKLLDKSRSALGKYLNVPFSELVFVPNATTGVNTVLRSLKFEPGDKILYFDFIYGACGKAILYVEETTPAKAVKIDVQFPINNEELVRVFRETVERESKDGKVRVAVFDTVVSLPGVRLPFEELVGVCKDLGVLSLVDAAHGIGHLELDLGALDADFFVTNCHKWLYVPRGSAVFHVPLRNQKLIRTSLPTSHGFQPLDPVSAINNPLPPSEKSPFIEMFDFVGTIDSSPYLCIPAALAFRSLVCGGESAIMTYSSTIAKSGAELIAKRLGTEVLEMDGDCCMYNIHLPIVLDDVRGVKEADVGAVTNYLTRAMVEEFRTFLAVVFYNKSWLVRVSGQIYVDMEDFEFAAGVLEKLVERVREGKYLV
ncbi:hypothetical protein RUND412_003325 [Rhizina undulata]